MSHSVRIEQFDSAIEVEANETILEAALFAGLDYPFACQQGQCGSCKSFLIAGQVDMGAAYNPLACTDEERARGLILACQAQPLTDCVVSVVELGGAIVHAVRELSCSVMEIERVGEAIQIVRLRIDSGGPFNFVAGQYVFASFDDMPEQAYALASTPAHELIELHLYGAPTGLSQSALVPGSSVRLRGPFGDAYLHDEHLGPIVAIAHGAGIAPMLSIAQSACQLGLVQAIHLYAQVAPQAEAHYVARLEALAAGARNFKFKLVDARSGSLAAIVRDQAPLASARVYLAGTAVEVAEIEAMLADCGIDPALVSRMRFDSAGALIE